MKQPHALTLAALSLLLAAGTSQAAIVLNAVRDYDSTNNPNTVDRFVEGNADASSYSAFQSAVSSAFTAGNGGVLNFDLTGNQNNQRTITGNFGGGKVLTIESSNEVNAQSSSNIPGISGDRFLFESASSTPQVTTYSFTVSGGAPGEYVSQVGFTLLTRANAGGNPTISASVRYTDGTFSDIASIGFTQTASTNGEDTFYLFTAPEGKAIDQLIIDRGASGDFRRGLDDLAFITVPEPSALALGALGLLPLLRRRRN